MIMLKRKHRLSTKFEFNVTRKYGTKVRGKYCSVFFLKPDNYEGVAKTGIVVSTKIHKNAVKRNRLKRVFSDCVRKKIDTLPDNFWMVVHPNTKSLEASHEEICADINTLLPKVLKS